MEKVRKAFYVEEELLGQVDALLPQADVVNHTYEETAAPLP